MQGNALFAVALIVGYALGSVPFGLLLTRAAGLGDIRKVGSGNIGATNVLRTGRKGLAAATLLLDAAKGAVAVLIFGGVPGLVAGFGAMLGHAFPVWLGFRGGKGVATALGVLLAAAWWLGLAAAVVWGLTVALTKTSSLGAIAACIAAPLIAAATGNWPLTVFAAALAVLVLIRHHANIRRLLAGTEPRIGSRKRA